MKKVLALLAIILGACVVVTDVHEASEPTAQELICAETQWEGCMDVEAPIPVFSSVVPVTHYGFYFYDEPYIFINPREDADMQWYTEVHETVHYLIYELGLEQYSARCTDEYMARVLTAKLTALEYNDSWLEQYGCNAGYNILKGLY